MRLDTDGKEAVVGLLMAVRVATRLSDDPIGEIELALNVDGSLRQNGHCDGDSRSRFENYLELAQDVERASENTFAVLQYNVEHQRVRTNSPCCDCTFDEKVVGSNPTSDCVALAIV